MSALPKRLPLPGIANPNVVAHRLLVDGPAPGPRMAADTAKHLATHYGSLSFDIARMANENPELARRIHPDAPEIWAQAGLRPRPRVGRDGGRRAAPPYDADHPGLATDEIRAGRVDAAQVTLTRNSRVHRGGSSPGGRPSRVPCAVHTPATLGAQS
ncbi:hypothetical protein STANM309S_04832 [Streptomyces tanashiensis]